MAHGSASNFIRQTVGSSVGTTDPETIDVQDASAFPDPSTSQYDIVIWDAGSFNRPDQDSNVEVLTVTGRDTGNNTLTCARGQQGTTNTSHPNTSDVIIAPLSVGDFNEVRSQSVSTDNLTTTNNPYVINPTNGERREEGSVTHDHAAASDDTWSTNDEVLTTVTFDTAFSTSPDLSQVFANCPNYLTASVDTISTTGMRVRTKNYTTTDHAPVDIGWTAVGGD